MDELITWLRGMLEEDERSARAWADEGITEGRGGAPLYLGALFLLADIEAKRAILDLHRPADTMGDGNSIDCVECSLTGRPNYPCRTVRLLASAYCDRPGYRQEWGVGGTS